MWPRNSGVTFYCLSFFSSFLSFFLLSFLSYVFFSFYLFLFFLSFLFLLQVLAIVWRSPPPAVALLTPAIHWTPVFTAVMDYVVDLLKTPS